MMTISISDLKARLSAKIKSLSEVGEFVVCDRGHPVAILSSCKKNDFFAFAPKNKRTVEQLKASYKPLTISGEAVSHAMRFLTEDRSR